MQELDVSNIKIQR